MRYAMRAATVPITRVSRPPESQCWSVYLLLKAPMAKKAKPVRAQAAGNAEPEKVPKAASRK